MDRVRTTKADKVNEARMDRVAQVRRRIVEGFYENQQVLDQVVDRLLLALRKAL